MKNKKKKKCNNKTKNIPNQKKLQQKIKKKLQKISHIWKMQTNLHIQVHTLINNNNNNKKNLKNQYEKCKSLTEKSVRRICKTTRTKTMVKTNLHKQKEDAEEATK